jgi:hypothetical protein
MKFLSSLVLLAVGSACITSGSYAIAEEQIPTEPITFLKTFCTDCHEKDNAEAGFRLDHESLDWTQAKTRKHWEMVHMLLSRKMMPPEEADQPSTAERAKMVSWIDQELVKSSPIGGSTLRRLNRREYINTIRTLFKLEQFELPAGFPQDNESHGFDTMGKALVISPSHFESYAETATKVADYLLPPITADPKPRTWEITPQDMVISYSSALVVDEAMRLASRGSITRNCSWPSKFEAPYSGTYKVTFKLSTKKPPKGNPPEFAFSAIKNQGKGERPLKKMIIKPGDPQTFRFEVDLSSGENLLFRYANAPLNFEDASFPKFVTSEFAKDPKLAAAWAKVATTSGRRGVPRGGNGWTRLKEALKDPKLDAKKYKPGSEAVKGLVRKHFGGKGRTSGETLIYKYFEEGPNIGIHHVTIEGPVKLIEDQEKIQQKKISEAFAGQLLKNPTDQAISLFLSSHLSDTFRRPATEQEISNYLALVKQEMEAGLRVEDGLHLAIRTSLLSPSFLYRERGTGELDQFELASRLSYFLTSKQPDHKLLSQAKSNSLTDKSVIKAEALRLIRDRNIKAVFAADFTSQWLDTNLLDSLMPDPSLFKNFNDKHRTAMKSEVERTFQEILIQNKPVTDFIAPDFIHTDGEIGSKIYQLKKLSKSKTLKRVTIPRDGRAGGILSMPAVMMATANGVDTQPVLRGVWLMENVLGTPPPEPPKGVPALPPDTAEAKGPRAKLEAHMADSSCARCHKEIDPLGFVLENYDPVGRWRSTYPSVGKKNKGMPIDASGVMPDGTKLKDVTDLKRFLVKHPEFVTKCISEKLLTYATGRSLNYREKKIIEEIALENIKQGNGFRDLLLELISSEVFLAR